MITDILKSLFISLGVASVLQYLFFRIESEAVFELLKANITNLQVALLAVNAATLGIVLTKIKELIDKKGVNTFDEVKMQMLLSIKEQIALIVTSLIIIALISAKSPPVNIEVDVYKVALLATFVYTLLILYDTANSVFVILDN